MRPSRLHRPSTRQVPARGWGVCCYLQVPTLVQTKCYDLLRSRAREAHAETLQDCVAEWVRGTCVKEADQRGSRGLLRHCGDRYDDEATRGAADKGPSVHHRVPSMVTGTSTISQRPVPLQLAGKWLVLPGLGRTKPSAQTDALLRQMLGIGTACVMRSARY